MRVVYGRVQVFLEMIIFLASNDSKKNETGGRQEEDYASTNIPVKSKTLLRPLKAEQQDLIGKTPRLIVSKFCNEQIIGECGIK